MPTHGKGGRVFDGGSFLYTNRRNRPPSNRLLRRKVVKANDFDCSGGGLVSYCAASAARHCGRMLLFRIFFRAKKNQSGDVQGIISINSIVVHTCQYKIKLIRRKFVTSDARKKISSPPNRFGDLAEYRLRSGFRYKIYAIKS